MAKDPERFKFAADRVIARMKKIGERIAGRTETLVPENQAVQGAVDDAPKTGAEGMPPDDTGAPPVPKP